MSGCYRDTQLPRKRAHVCQPNLFSINNDPTTTRRIFSEKIFKHGLVLSFKILFYYYYYKSEITF